MSIHVALHHRTTYRYDRPVSLGPQTVRLRPAPHCRSRVLAYALKVKPSTHFLNWQQDLQSNWLARLVFPEKTRELSIDVDLVVEMAAYNPFDFFLEPSAEKWPFVYDADLANDLAPYLRLTPWSPLLDNFVSQLPKTTRMTNDFVVSLNQQVSQMIAYGVRLEAGLQTPEETLEKAPWLVPRLRLVARPDLPAPRDRGALRVRVSRAARRRYEAARGSAGGPRRTSSICTRGARCTSRARAGLASTRRRGSSQAKDIFRSRAPRSRLRRRR